MNYQKLEYNVFCPYRPKHTNIVVESINIDTLVPDATGIGYGRFRRLWPVGSNYAYGTAGVVLTETGFVIPAKGKTYNRGGIWPDQDTDLESANCECRKCGYRFNLDLLRKDRELIPNSPIKVGDEVRISDQHGGFTILERRHESGRALYWAEFNTLWQPLPVVGNHSAPGKCFLVDNHSFYQLNDDVTEAYFRVEGYRETVLMWFDNKTGKRIA